jgi:hypothetical protein
MRPQSSVEESRFRALLPAIVLGVVAALLGVIAALWP